MASLWIGKIYKRTLLHLVTQMRDYGVFIMKLTKNAI